MSRLRFRVLLPPLLLGFFTLTAQTILLRRFLWQVGATETSVGLFLAAWLTWIGVGAAVVGTRPGNRLVEALTGRLPLALLWYLPLLCAQVFLIEHVRALVGVSAYVTPPLDRLLLGALLANAPVSLATGLLFPASARWLKARGGTATLAYALDTAGGVAAGFLVTVLLALGTQLDGGHRRDWQRLFSGSPPEGAFATPAATYLYGLRGGTFYVVSAGRTVEMLPEREQSGDIAALLLARVPEPRRILMLGHAPLSLALSLRTLHPQAHLVWCHDDPVYARAVEGLARQHRLIDAPIEVPASGPQPFLAACSHAPGERYDLVLVWPANVSTAAGAALCEPPFLRQVAAVLQPGGVVALPLGGGAGGSWSLERRQLAGAVIACARDVWPAGGLLAPGAGGWWLTGPGDQPAPDVGELLHRFGNQYATRVPIAVMAELYDPERAAEMLHLCGADRVRARPDPARLQCLGLACELHAEWPAWSLARQMGWLERHAGVGLTLLVLGALWLAPAACGGKSGAAWRLVLAWLAAESFLGLAGLLTLMRSLEARFGSLYLLAGLASCLYLAGLFAGNRLGERALPPGASGRWVPALTVAHGLLLWLLARFVAPVAAPHLVAGACFLAAVPVGVAIPVAVAKWRGLDMPADEVGALLARGDAWGGASGGFLCSLFLLPWLGGMQTCLAAFVFAGGMACITLVDMVQARLAARLTALVCLLLAACLSR